MSNNARFIPGLSQYDGYLSIGGYPLSEWVGATSQDPWFSTARVSFNGRKIPLGHKAPLFRAVAGSDAMMLGASPSDTNVPHSCQVLMPANKAYIAIAVSFEMYRITQDGQRKQLTDAESCHIASSVLWSWRPGNSRKATDVYGPIKDWMPGDEGKWTKTAFPLVFGPNSPCAFDLIFSDDISAEDLGWVGQPDRLRPSDTLCVVARLKGHFLTLSEGAATNKRTRKDSFPAIKAIKATQLAGLEDMGSYVLDGPLGSRTLDSCTYTASTPLLSTVHIPLGGEYLLGDHEFFSPNRSERAKGLARDTMDSAYPLAPDEAYAACAVKFDVYRRTSTGQRLPISEADLFQIQMACVWHWKGVGVDKQEKTFGPIRNWRTKERRTKLIFPPGADVSLRLSLGELKAKHLTSCAPTDTLCITVYCFGYLLSL